MPPVDAELELNIDAAFQVLDDLNTRFDDIASAFGDSVSSVLDQAFQDTTTKLSDYLSQSADQFGSDLGGLDLTAIGDSIQSSFDNVDTSGLTNQLQDALTTEPIQLTLDTADLTSQLQDALDSVDTTGLDTSLGDTSSALDQVTASSEKTGLGLETASQAAQALGIGADAATGSFSGLVESAVPGAAAFAGVAASISELVKRADEAQLAAEQLNSTFGKSANVVKTLNIAGLNTDLDGLSKLTGASVPKLELVASGFGQLAINAGKTQVQAASMSKELIVLAANAAAAKPSLGSASDVIAQIQTALGGNVRALARYGISLTRTQIDQEAMKETSKTLRTELTPLDRQTAALSLSMKQLGDTVGGRVQDSAKLATVQFRVLKEELATTAAQIGTPLITPVLSLIHALLPLGEVIAQTFGEFASAALPAVANVAQVIGSVLLPVLHGLFDALKFLEPIIPPLVDAFIALKAAALFQDVLTGLASGFAAVARGAEELGAVKLAGGLGTIAQGAETGSAGLGILTEALTSAAGGVALVSLALPAALIYMSAFGDITSGVDTNIQHLSEVSVKNLAKEFDGITSGIASVNKGLASNQDAISSNITSYEGLAKASDDAIGKITAHGGGEIVNDQYILEASLKSLESQMKKVSIASPEMGQKLIDAGLAAGLPEREIQRLNAILAESTVQHDKVAKKSAEVAAAAQVESDKQNALTASIIAGNTANSAAAFATSLSTALLKSQTSVSQAAVTAAVALTSATHLGTEAVRAQATAYAQGQAAAKEYKSALDILNTGTLTLTQAEVAQDAAVQGWKTVLQETKGSIDLTTEAGVKNYQSILGQTQAVEAHNHALTAAGAPQAVIKANTDAFTQSLIDQEESLGQSDQAVAGLLDKLGLTAPASDTAVAAFQKLGTSIGTDLPAKSDSGQAAVTAALQKMVDGTKTAVKTVADIFNNDTSVEAGAAKMGRSAAEGLANGINNEDSRRLVKNAVRNLAEAATSTLKVTLEVQSPSKVFTRLGEQTAQGFALGLVNLAPQVQSAAQGLASAAVSGITPIPGPIAGPVSATAGVVLAGSIPGAAASSATNAGAPLIGEQNFYGMDPQAAAATTGREMAIAQRFAGV